jgi:hypothetical protein
MWRVQIDPQAVRHVAPFGAVLVGAVDETANRAGPAEIASWKATWWDPLAGGIEA